ncbi:MAG TPA: hypothetical protein VMS49_07230 [Lysobacter sp.]|nr:hypothetical protein [Lysobacter sp.]
MKSAAKKASKKTATKKAATKKVATRKAATRKAATKKTVARKPVAKKATKKTAARRARPRHITPEQALENTRALLEAKQAKAHETPPWQALAADHGGHVPESGTFQSDEARSRAVGRDQEELRSQGNAGSAGTIDRHNQGKRDARNG